MPKRHPNYRLVKIHLSYTVAEVAGRLDVHRNTVREWIRCGLPTVGHKRSTLILGEDLRDFLKARRLRNRRPCEPGQIYCVRCRVPRNPAGGWAEYRPQTATLGSLVGICPECDCVIYRRASEAKLEQVRGQLEILMAQGPRRRSESTEPSVNCDLENGAGPHEKAPCR